MTNIFIGFLVNDEEYIKIISNTYLLNANINYQFFSINCINGCIEFYNYYDIIEWIYKKINPDFAFICSQDVYININNLIKLIETIDKKLNIYCGGHGDYRTIGNETFYFHSPNPGIILSNGTLKLLSNTKLFTQYNNLCKKHGSDLVDNFGVGIGYCAHLLNLEQINSSNIHYCNCNGYPCHINQIDKNNLISCSNMSINDIINEYKINGPKNKLVIYTDGGLGNLLFQYFHAVNLSIQYNYELFFVKNLNYWRGDINKYKIFSNLNFIDETSVNNLDHIKINESTKEYKPLKLIPNTNYVISGYFQSYKYFINNISTIKLQLIENVKNEFNEIKQKFNYKNTCLIHVRRGDYLKYPKVHPICSNEYYLKSIDYIESKFPDINFIIFSDDINYITNWNILKNINHKIIKENDPIKILLMMSMCEHFIIANSTLSLASYFLSDNLNSIIIGPKIWFGIDGPKYNINDILPPNAIIF